MEELAYNLSEYVRNVRKEKGLKVKDVCNRCALSRSYINMIEAGLNPKTKKPIVPSLETIVELSKGLDVPCLELLTSIGFINQLEDEQLLSYRQFIEEVLVYKYSMLNMDFKALPFETKQRIIDEIDDFIGFQTYKTLHKDQ